MASDIWLRTTQIAREEFRCCLMGYSFRLTARVLLYAPSHRQDSTYHGLCYISRGALAGTRNNSISPPHEGSIWRSIAPWANALPLSYYKCCTSLPKTNFYLQPAYLVLRRKSQTPVATHTTQRSPPHCYNHTPHSTWHYRPHSFVTWPQLVVADSPAPRIKRWGRR